MDEIWKDIIGFEGYYQVSDLGNVKSLNRYILGVDGKERFIKARIMKIRIAKDGCARINLTRDGIKTVYPLARIVYKAFNPEFDYSNADLVIYHKDDNQAKNEIKNLYIVKKKDVPELPFRIFPNHKGDKKAIKCITTNKEFNSISEASVYYHIEFSSISKCCNGKQKSAGKLFDGTKLVWKFME